MTHRTSLSRTPVLKSGLAAIGLALGLTLGLALTAPSPARADRCDDLAKDLTAQIPGLKIGKTIAGVIYLEHPAVTQASLGCPSRNRSNDVFASTDKKRPSPDFYDFVATAAALVFTIPMNDTLKGA